jgi:hypothetical protein
VRAGDAEPIRSRGCAGARVRGCAGVRVRGCAELAGPTAGRSKEGDASTPADAQVGRELEELGAVVLVDEPARVDAEVLVRVNRDAHPPNERLAGAGIDPAVIGSVDEPQ